MIDYITFSDEDIMAIAEMLGLQKLTPEQKLDALVDSFKTPADSQQEFWETEESRKMKRIIFNLEWNIYRSKRAREYNDYIRA